MDEMSISSQVGELHQPLNNTLKDPRQNNSCSLSPYLRKRERERGRERGREGERNIERGRRGGGRRHRTKDDKIKVICEICHALI